MAMVKPRAAAPRRPRPPRSTPARPRRQRANTRIGYDIAGVSLIAVALILLVTMLWPAPEGENVFGRALVHGLRLVVGAGVWLFPPLIFLCGALLAVGRSRSWDNVGGALALFLVFVSWWHLGHVPHAGQFAADNLLQFGGYIGAALSFVVRAAVGTVGGHVLFAAFAAFAFLWLTDIPLPTLVAPVESAARKGTRAAVAGARGAFDRRRTVNRRNAVPSGPRSYRGAGDDGDDDRSSRSTAATLFRRNAPEPDADALAGRKVDVLAAEDAALRPPPVKKEPSKKSPINPDAPLLENVGDFPLPPLSLLRPASPQKHLPTGESDAKRQVLLQTLDDFGIGADVAQVAHGPTITRYEVALDRGIKVSKIVSLADNLAMALAAIDVRVEAPIPGKSAIGIEVPNEHATPVNLREVIERPEFQSAPSKLTFALGKDVTGVCRYADLAKMPHLLIGGSTGSGKSVCLNTMICSLLYRASPREVKFLMIDPKKVELSLYDGIPHLAAPVITNVKQAPSVFKQAIKEMEGRYDLFAKAGTRNLDGYNSRVSEEERLPYWVIIVDELADLMMQSGPEIETAICRLAQLARATGIHLVIATQRPSVNVITGTIKANISSRIAFAVNSAVDSRTILDMMGADRLIGRGDMLFMPIDAAKPQRIQGCFVSEKETEDLVAYLKAQAQPNYEVLPSSLSLANGEDDGGEEDADDDLFESAVKLVVTNGQASTSMLQRRFKIGYTRAARLVDIMEQRGIVGALDGAKPREILMSRDQIDGMFTRGGGGAGEE
uniref:DNA translocase FtsK n=1 Tax=uncultured Armatimonadetes bacterium TaxID=157466 RepID=A0A6J4K745_9BACT|nr:DNA translocase FtsK [uncultured Armatimonadetes bacterium]